MAASSIPVAGNFVGAAAQVGLAFVEALQTVEQNVECAGDLEAQTMRLQKLLKRFTEKASADQGDGTAERIEELQGCVKTRAILWR
ncbi:hypothetical protein FRB90_010107 [Tulasnella sp. 427]|nr:hypothetical protein FRB90_010107 [Tulasnella sp. 427]